MRVSKSEAEARVDGEVRRNVKILARASLPEVACPDHRAF
jgi:hypothetical protein